MAAEVLPHIFEPHFTTKNAQGGAGLGLFMVRELAAGLGGAVEVDSKPGAGSTFRVFLPGTTREKKSEAGEHHVSTLDSSGRILLADDDPLVLEAAESILGHFGHEVTAEESGPAVLARLRRQPGRFNLLIVNRNMPGMDGIEAAAEAKRLEPGLPIVLMTGLMDAAERQRFSAVGIDEIIIKPVTARELGRIVGGILRENHETRRNSAFPNNPGGG